MDYIPRCHLRSNSLVYIKNYLFIVWIRPIINKNLEFIYRSKCSDSTGMMVRYQYYMISLRYTRNTKCICFAYIIVTISVWIFVYRDVMQSALFFAYKNVMQSYFLIYIKMSYPHCQFQEFNEELRNTNVRFFVFYNAMQIILLFAKCLDLVYKNVT